MDISFCVHQFVELSNRYWDRSYRICNTLNCFAFFVKLQELRVPEVMVNICQDVMDFDMYYRYNFMDFFLDLRIMNFNVDN